MWTIESRWLDVAVLVSLLHAGTLLFGQFEEHKPAWRRLLKAPIFVALLIALELSVGRTSAIVVFVLLFCCAGSIHFWWLSKHGINGWTGEPHDKFIALVKGRQRGVPNL